MAEHAELFDLFVRRVEEYAVYLLDPGGHVLTWNSGAERIKGYTEQEVVGRHLSIFYPPEDRARAAVVLKTAAVNGHYEEESWRVRKNGTRFWGSVSLTALWDQGELKGFAKITRDLTERKQAEERLRATELKYDLLMAGVKEYAVFLLDADGRVIDWSPAAERLLGFRAEEILGHSLKAFFPPEEQGPDGTPAKVLREARERGRTAEESWHVRKDGSRFWGSGITSALRDESGELHGFAKVLLDRTDRKRAEDALLASEERFRRAADAAPVLIWVANRERQCTWFNQRWLEFTGRSLEQEAGRGWTEGIHPSDRGRVATLFQEAFDSQREYSLEYRLRRTDGEYRWILENGTPLYEGPEGEFTGYIGSGIDITERRRGEAQLQRAEQTSRLLADVSVALAELTDYESTLGKVARMAVPVFADWCAVDILENGNLRRVAVQHSDPTKIEVALEYHRRYPPDPDSTSAVATVLKTGDAQLVGSVTDEMLKTIVKDPERVRMLQELGVCSYIGVPLKVRGDLLGVITFVSSDPERTFDAADMVVAQDLAMRAAIAIDNARLYAAVRDADHRKDEFLAMLAHELRNPLAPIRSGLDVLQLEGIESEIINTIAGQVDHVVRLVDDLLDVSRILRGKVELRKQPTDLAETLNRAVETVRPRMIQHQQQLTVSLPPEPIPLVADPVRLTQVVVNLLHNASKYTDDGGSIGLEAEKQGGMIVIRVSDTGIGIPPELLPEVFTLFTQADQALARSQGGLGIGLTVVKSLVEMHGGTVSGKSDGPNQGSVFTVRIPIISPSQRKPPPDRVLSPDRKKGLAASTCRILVVDDNVPGARLLVRLLERLGTHKVWVAHDGEAGLAAAEKHHPDMIFLDIGLPKVDGLEVARQLRRKPEFRDTLLVALTGYGTQEDRRRSFESGFDEHLVKPPVVEILRAVFSHPKLHHHLKSPAAEQ